MKRRRWKNHRHSDEATMQPPKYWPGDPIVSVDDGTPGRVEYARHDAMVCVMWDHSGKREWLHEAALQFAPGFAPVRRR
jgi:hypothetical protein